MAKNKSKTHKRNITSKNSLPKIGSSHIFIVIGLTIITLLIAANIQTKQNLTASAQNVLGDDEQSEEQKQAEEQQKESEKQAEEEQKEAEKNAEELNKESEGSKSNSEDEINETKEDSNSYRSSIKSNAQTNTTSLKIKKETENDKEETEIETADGQKIKTKIEDDGTTKIEVENGAVKLKYRIENGKVVLKIENEEGENIEIDDEDLEELENEVEDVLEDDDINLIPTLDNKLALTQNNLAAITNFPLSINIETKELILNTPTGQKTISILPEEAIQNLLNSGIINKIDETQSSEILPNDQNTNLTGIIKIETYDDKIAYRIQGEKTQKILGIIPINTPVTAFVSTETGLPIAKEQSMLTNLIDLISP